MGGAQPPSAPFTAAAVQAAPVFLDLAASVDKAAALMEEAASHGASLVGFPEGFLPGHPGWVELLPFDANALALAKELFLDAVEVPGPAVATLQAVAADLGVNVVMGICQRRPATTGTLYNAQLHIDATGTVTGVHQKYVPTVGERLVHAPGTTGSRCAFPSTVGAVSGLICGENSNPLAQYAAARAYPVAHVASWPHHFGPELDMASIIPMVSRALAYSLKTHVLSCVGTVSPEMIARYGAGHMPFLQNAAGRSAIFGPGGDVLAEAGSDDEQIVYAVVDPEVAIIPKFVHDVAGHYNRPELFEHLLRDPGWTD